MTLSNIIKLKTNDGLDVIDFLVEVMHDCYEDFQICHRLQAAKLLTTYGNEDAPYFIDDNPREPRSNRNGRKPKRPTKFDTELARVIKEDTRDGRSIARFLINVMEGELKSFKPHHRMSAARELLDRGFGKSARSRKNHPSTPPKQACRTPPLPGERAGVRACPGLDPGAKSPPTTTSLLNPTTPRNPPLTPHSSPLTPQPKEHTLRAPRNSSPNPRIHKFTQLTNDIRHDPSHISTQTTSTRPSTNSLRTSETLRSNYLQYNGDEVTEGVIDLDPIGLDRIHFRAKLSIDPIDELEIRDFSGSLDRRDAATGMFITTSDFTDVARSAAETITTENRPIRLVDGTELARYLASLKMERKTASAHKPEENHPNQHT